MAENGYAKEVLVTTDWLADHLGESGLVVAEVDENPDVYEEGHVPGAVKLHWREDLQDPIERDLISKDAFEAARRRPPEVDRRRPLPHRRALGSHLVRTSRAVGLRRRQELRRL